MQRIPFRLRTYLIKVNKMVETYLIKLFVEILREREREREREKMRENFIQFLPIKLYDEFFCFQQEMAQRKKLFFTKNILNVLFDTGATL